LPEIEDFDGVIVFSSTMNFSELVEDIRQRAECANVPAVSVGIRVDGMSFVGTNNKESMFELAEHLVTDHNVQDIEFIAGPKGNENSDLRVDAVRDVFNEHEVPFREECVHYGDWSVRGAMDMVREILETRGEHLPDAFICANDNLAMAACAEIEKIGMRVPEDVIVTGFDNVYDGQIFFPSLCTVGQDDFIVGNCACDTLIRMITQGVTDDIVIKNHFIRNQSCGCTNHVIEELRLKECKNRFYEKIAALEFGWSNGWVSQSVLASNDKEEIKKNLQARMEKTSMFGTIGTTYILEDGHAEHYFDGRQDVGHIEGYSDELEVLVAFDRRKKIEMDKMPRRELIPGYQKGEKDSRMFLFMPAHFLDWVFGYVVVEDWLEGISSAKIKTFVDNFNHTVDKLKQNIALERLNDKLKDLYTKDSLTGMYNRFGFEEEGVRIFEHCLENKEQMVLMFTDINRMKLINDYYGHLQGDVAIKTVADAIHKNIPKDWIAVRFGGDEFLVIGSSDNVDEIQRVQQNIGEDVKITGKAMHFPFYLSVSCGYLHFVPEENRTLDSYIKQADEAMYEIKANMHMSDPELRQFVEACSKNPV